ncbi:M15 family metallopeptidase [Thalassobacillus pellis]|uniref:M15 family metallopeptidase n=1 Tax=Thalassobacillus pellis TaxID=748008 RepID=UPI001EF7853C|nr:M15 family metallopeptidase [Thalassobacillus pellis]MBM7554286.1 peptidoglycan L-alanyl-D-glutamate endopeptidase CwlK [Thalassobacillus pellis]
MFRKINNVVAWLIMLMTIGFIIVLFIDGEDGWQPSLPELPDPNAPMPEKLHPKVAEKKDILIEKAEEKGIKVVITEGLRSKEEQNALYKRGRSQEGNIVTYAEGGESYHNYGLAIDFALRNDKGKVIWNTAYDGNDNGKSDWMEVVSIAKSLGFEWGGDWERFKDYPHLQLDMGYSIRELQMGFRPDILEEKSEEQGGNEG